MLVDAYESRNARKQLKAKTGPGSLAHTTLEKGFGTSGFSKMTHSDSSIEM